mmetsp:Transcript_19442/g.28975  ORF Transcript_19442/g.28975 Transcript_19442/m.28975 type:complete len:228 (+) Transcript_19442:3-686(+)
MKGNENDTNENDTNDMKGNENDRKSTLRQTASSSADQIGNDDSAASSSSLSNSSSTPSTKGAGSSSSKGSSSKSDSTGGQSRKSSSGKRKHKYKKFNFKDLKDRFEEWSATNTDFVVYITGFETKRNLLFSFTVYRIKVCLDQQRWLIFRTYNDFKELHAKLEKTLPTIKLPTLPRGKFFGQMDTNFVKERKNDLQVYTESLLKIPSVCKSEIFQFFLKNQNSVITE